MKKRYWVLIGLLIVAMVTSIVIGVTNSKVKYPEYERNRFLYDIGYVLDKDAKSSIENMTQEFQSKTAGKANMYVVCLNKLSGLEISEYASTLFNKWGLGYSLDVEVASGEQRVENILLVVCKNEEYEEKIFIMHTSGLTEFVKPESLTAKFQTYLNSKTFAESVEDISLRTIWDAADKYGADIVNLRFHSLYNPIQMAIEFGSIILVIAISLFGIVILSTKKPQKA